MKIAIGSVGRLVAPKALRAELGITAGVLATKRGDISLQ
jgi:hypothetical protein